MSPVAPGMFNPYGELKSVTPRYSYMVRGWLVGRVTGRPVEVDRPGLALGAAHDVESAVAVEIDGHCVLGVVDATDGHRGPRFADPL